MEKHLRIRMAHLSHVLPAHHGHTAFAHGVKDNFYLAKLTEHLEQPQDFGLLKIVEQSAGGHQNGSIRHIRADLPDPVLSKGIPGKIGFPLRFWQQFLPVFDDMGQIHGIPACPPPLSLR